MARVAVRGAQPAGRGGGGRQGILFCAADRPHGVPGVGRLDDRTHRNSPLLKTLAIFPGRDSGTTCLTSRTLRGQGEVFIPWVLRGYWNGV